MPTTPTKNPDYGRLSDKLKLVIDSFACNLGVTEISRLITTRFGEEETIKISTVQGYKRQYQPLILKRRKELGRDLPIMNPADRFRLLQEVVDLSMEGEERVTRTGEVISVRDLKTAVSALKLAHDMTTKVSSEDIGDDDIIRQIVTEAFTDLRQANPESTTAEICNKLIETLSEDARPFIEELQGE